MVQPIPPSSRTRQLRRWSHRMTSLPVLALLTVAVLLASLGWGAYEVSGQELIRALGRWLGVGETPGDTAIGYILLHIRLPRVALGMLVGSLLAISGAALQALFRNPLADPGLIGVSSGAMLFTVMGIVWGAPLAAWLGASLGYAFMAALGFAGGALATWLVYRLATVGRRTYVSTMLLAGVAIGAIAGAMTGLFTYFSSEEQLRDITFWTLGSLSPANWTLVGILMPVAALVITSLTRLAPALNLFLLGEEEAGYAGVDTQRVKRIVILCTALGVGASVCAAGMIGFVGLVVPHVLRLIRGADLRWVLPASALAGGALLTLADSLARTAIAPAELPIGVLTALLGGPFFLWLLLRNRGRFAAQF